MTPAKGDVGAADEETEGEDERGEAGDEAQLDDARALQVKLLDEVAAQEGAAPTGRDRRETYRGQSEVMDELRLEYKEMNEGHNEEN